jgi:histone H3/H4
MAQNNPSTKSAAEALWPLIEKQLEQLGGDTAKYAAIAVRRTTVFSRRTMAL